MTGRSVASMVLAGMTCGLPSLCVAQVSGPAGQVVTLPPEAGGFGGAYASPSFGDSGGYAAGGYGEVMPAGGYAGPACPPQGADCPPEPASWWPWKCKPLFISPKMLEPPRGTYVRFEYLLWEIEEPGNITLGAPVVEDPTTPLVEFAERGDNTTSDGFFTLQNGFQASYAPNIDELQLRDNNGMRITVGVPLKNYGTFEGDVWLLNEASDHYEWDARSFGFFLTEFLPTIPVKTDGVSGEIPDDFFYTGNALVFDTYEVDYESDMWGGDARFVVDALTPPGEGLKLRPLFGFKYVGLQEALHQKGLSDGFFTGPFSTTIDSDTDNTILGGTVGLRAELEHRWFRVGVEPAVTFAGNISRATVVTERVLGPTDPRTETTSDYFDFSPILDLKTYARVKVMEGVNLHVGYDAFWLSHVYRPARVIEYNVATDPATGFQTAFDTKREDDHVAVEGLSVGLEFVF